MEKEKSIQDETKNQILNKYFYDKGYQVGVRKFYELMKEKEPDSKLSFRYILNWLKEQPVYQKNQLTRQTRHIKPIVSKRKFALIQIDLIDYSQNSAPNGYKYLVNIIDVWSRYSWLIPIKNKQANTVLKIFQKWYDENKDDEYPMRILNHDNGMEFVEMDKFLKEKGIKALISTNSQSQGIVERSNQTIRRLLSKNIIVKNPNSRWGLIGLINKNYNQTYHEAIKMTPEQKFNLLDEELKQALDDETKIDADKKTKTRATRRPISNSNVDLEAGDWVRIKKLKKNPLDKTKGFLNWSDDIYTVMKKITARKEGRNDRYKIKILDGNELKKTFYRDDLLKISDKTVLDNQAVGKPDDNVPDIVEEEIRFEIKTEDEPIVEPVKRKRTKKQTPAIQTREKSTRVKTKPTKLDL